MSDWMNCWNDFQKSAEKCFRFLRAEDLMHTTHISLHNKYLYVETAKVACSTIKKILINGEYAGKAALVSGEKVHFREFSPLINARQVGNFQVFLNRPDIFKFCFVRNPYARLLSCYLDKIKQRKPQSHPLMIQLGYGPFSEKILSFEEFVNAVIEQPVGVMDGHWRTQYYATFQEGIDYDFIGRFENFEKDLKKAIKQTNIDFDKYYSVQDGHATKASEQLNSYYTPELAEKIYQKFKIDFDYFGYDKELKLV